MTQFQLDRHVARRTGESVRTIARLGFSALPDDRPADPRPGTLYLAIDCPRCRRDLRARGIVPRIARRGIESSKHLGRHRWVVERTFAWVNQFRRLIVRYERHADLYRAFLLLAAAIICFRSLERFC